MMHYLGEDNEMDTKKQSEISRLGFVFLKVG